MPEQSEQYFLDKASQQPEIDYASEQYDVDNASSGISMDSHQALIKSQHLNVLEDGHFTGDICGRISGKLKIFTCQEEAEDVEGLIPFWASDREVKSDVYTSFTLTPIRNELIPGVSLKFVAKPRSAWKWEDASLYTTNGVLKVSNCQFI